jgi:hypothetical protein
VANGGGATNTARFFIKNPSVLLHLTIEIFARNPSDKGQAQTYTGETWTLTAQADRDGSAVPTNAILTAQSLPDSYEASTGVKMMRGSVALADVHEDGVIYEVQCTWEPGQPGMGQEELDRLFSECELTADAGNVTVNITGG